MFRVFNDNQNYPSLMIDNENYLDLLTPYIGESKAMRLGLFNISVRKFWQPLKVYLFPEDDSANLPDISEWKTGMLLMNARAQSALKSTLEQYGEFLPCQFPNGHGYLFHCLNIRELRDMDIEYLTYRRNLKEVESLTLSSDLDGQAITGIKGKIANLYLSKKVITIIESEKLKGLVFHKILEEMLEY